MSPGEPIVRVREIRKSFNGVPAVDGVSFEVTTGSVVGFVGANGAGKTTTMRMMAAVDLPDSGAVTVCGFDAAADAAEVRRRVGWMPDSYGAYPHLSVVEYLDFYARLCGLRGSERAARVEEVLAFSGLRELTTRPVTGLSKGMAQRLCLGRALLPRPRFLIMDEPAAGLDPHARMDFKQSVAALQKEGVTLFISSHILSELEEMCDSLLFIDKGRIVHSGLRRALAGAGEGQEAVVVEIRVADGEEALSAWIGAGALWRLGERFSGGIRAEFLQNTPEALAGELQRMCASGLKITCFHPQERRLEEVFVDVLRARGHGAG
jgi:ABC-2 type transport system ATP-binding protein